SLEDADGFRCIDIIERGDGSFGFKEFRRDPEDRRAVDIGRRLFPPELSDKRRNDPRGRRKPLMVCGDDPRHASMSAGSRSDTLLGAAIAAAAFTAMAGLIIGIWSQDRFDQGELAPGMQAPAALLCAPPKPALSTTMRL